MDTETLRKDVKKLIIDAGLDKRGIIPVLAGKMGVHRSTLHNALSGYRTSKAHVELLKRLYKYLSKKIDSGKKAQKSR